MRIWLNGRVVERANANVSVFDRGFLFGDAVYELVRCFDGVPLGMDRHVARLRRSMALARIEGFDADDYATITNELLEALDTGDACIYLQVTRGVEPTRRHLPSPDLVPTVLAIGTESPPLEDARTVQPIDAIVRPDDRWHHCEIKATSLLAGVLAVMAADDAHAHEALLVRDGLLSEGATSNVFLRSGSRLVTPRAHEGPPILHGVMRALFIETAAAQGLVAEERDVPIAELHDADEVFISSSRRLLAPIRSIDGRPLPVDSDACAESLLGALLDRVRVEIDAAATATRERAS